MIVEWTNQHGCGGNKDSPHKTNCNIVIQVQLLHLQLCTYVSHLSATLSTTFAGPINTAITTTPPQMMCMTNGTDSDYPSGTSTNSNDVGERNAYIRDGTNTGTQVTPSNT